MESEASRPFTPRFKLGDEVSSNYEPVLVTNREFAVSPVIGVSPILPKRLARMELDAINNKKSFSQLEKLPDVPEMSQSQEEDEDEEIFEEIEAPTDDKSATSAFDNHATFYV